MRQPLHFSGGEDYHGNSDMIETAFTLLVALAFSVLFFGGGIEWFSLIFTKKKPDQQPSAIEASPLERMVGVRGSARTDLKLEGEIELAGIVYRAMSELDYVARGESVEVIRVEDEFLVVRTLSAKASNRVLP